MSEDDFQVKCVKPQECSEGPNSALSEAFHLLVEHGFIVVWVTQEDCLVVEEETKNCVYTMDPFDGPAFQHLKHLGCRIFGPQCILSTLLMKAEIPRRKGPIYNLAMKDVVVSCTNLDKKQREEIHILVELMGGRAIRDLTEDVTHLVAGEVGSQKYHVAASRGKPVMTVEWVDDVWQRAKHRHINATDEQFQKFRCPIFKGLVITTSGLSQDERKSVKQYVESEGGKYTGEMKLNECTHLIIKEPKGNKYEYARTWKINIVNKQWLYESLDRNFCQDEKNYFVESSDSSIGIKTSTPEKSRQSAMAPNIADISAITTSISHVNETALQSTRYSDMTATNFDELDFKSLPGEHVLDGCKIYLSGMKEKMLEKLKKIINAGGGTRFSVLNECVTHIVMGDRCDQDLKTFMLLEHKPHVVTPLWVAECLKQGCLVNVDSFLSPHLPSEEENLPKIQSLSRKSFAVKRINNNSQSSTSLKNNDSTFADASGKDEMVELISQYLDNESKEGERSLAVDEVDGDFAEQNERTENQESHAAEDGRIFSGKTFTFFGFSSDVEAALEDLVIQAGGQVLNGQSRQVPDYAIVPILGYSVEQNVGQVVAVGWLQMCIEAEVCLPVDGNVIFHPIHIDLSAQPLKKCVLSFSGFIGVERDWLINIAELQGAHCQEYFARNTTKTLKATTHLVVKEPSGSKYAAAKKWNVPALNKQWLIACAKSKRKEDENQYLIDIALSSSETSCGLSTVVKESVKADKSCSASVPTAMNIKPSTKFTSNSGTLAIEPSDQSHKTSEKHSVQSLVQKTRTNDNPNFQPVIEMESVKVITSQEAESNKISVLTTEEMWGQSLTHSRTDACYRENEEKMSSSSENQIDKDKIDCINPMAAIKAFAQKSLSQKENLTTAVHEKSMAASLGKRRPAYRVEELQQQSKKPILSPGLASPQTVLAPGFRPQFNLAAVFDYLESPDVPHTSRKRDSLPLEEVFQQCIKEGIKTSSIKRVANSDSSHFAQDEANSPLRGVVIFVSKKLLLNQTEYHNIADSLGGDYTWQYSSSCTHFIFQGRSNDTNKEFRLAKNEGKIIVSPHWLYECMGKKCKVDESMFPHNYNPNLNLGGIVKSETPLRQIRRSARNTPKPGCEDTNIHTPLQGKEHQMQKAIISSSVKEVDKFSAVQSIRKNDQDVEILPTTEYGLSAGILANQRLSPLPDEYTTALNSDHKNTHDSNSVHKKGFAFKNLELKGDNTNLAETSECGGSLEIREVLSKTLETVKAVSNQSKKSNRKKSGFSDGSSTSSGQHATCGNTSETPCQEQVTAQAQPLAHTTEHHGMEPSQSIQVTWDDPTCRREQEKLAYKLERVSSPSQNTEDFMAQMEIPEFDTPVKSHLENNGTSTSQSIRISTPEPSNLAMPEPGCKSNGCSHEVLKITSDGSYEVMKTPPVVLISGLAQEERLEFGVLVEQLGGRVLEKQQFDPACTHLIVGQPTRNEKFLAAVATGRWVLHKSYFIACRQNGRFVNEEDHEWGGPSMTSLLQNMSGQINKLAVAAYKWRRKVQNIKKTESSCLGAYQGWRVILLTDRSKEENFRRLLTAGGATVLNVRPPFTKGLDATHAFVEMHKINLSEGDLHALLSGVTYCLKPEYIAAHLTDDPAPSPEDFIPPEILTFKAKLSETQTRKRKSAHMTSSSSKRTRHKNSET